MHGDVEDLRCAIAWLPQSIAAHRDWTVGSSCPELSREPRGVARGADRAVEVEGFAQRTVGRRRVVLA